LDYIERANSGVIGVTGVRGAGKSALFKHVLQQCAGRFGRLEMTAPVAYERGTQSLMTLCRELAQRVIRDVEPALHGRPSTAVLAMRDLARRVPALLVLTLIVVILVGYGATRTYETYFNVQGSVISDTPFAFDQSYPQAVRIWPTNQIVREPPRFRETLTGLRDAESSVIEHVVADARRVLRLMQVKDERSSTNFIIGALLSPAATSGFTFAPVSTEILPPGLSMLAASWSLDAELVSQQALDLVGINFIREFYSLDTEDFRSLWDLYHDQQYSAQLTASDNFLDLLYFNYHVLGHELVINSSRTIFERFVCLDLIRGDLSLESRFAANTHSLRELLNDLEARHPSTQPSQDSKTEFARDTKKALVETATRRPTQFASLLLLDAWRRQPEGVFFTADDLGRLIVLLEEYLTLFPGTAQAIEAAETTDSSGGSTYDRWFQMGRAHWLTILIAAFLVLIYPTGRSAVLILRGLVNFRYVGLMRELNRFSATSHIPMRANYRRAGPCGASL
jgi:hypothetical protein